MIQKFLMTNYPELFIIIGPRKTGTTSISKWINQATHSKHKVIKETYFLCADRTLPKLEQYITDQPAYNNAIFLFEPSYFSDENAQKNIQKIIRDLNINVHIIAIRRDAVQRSLSELSHHMARSGLPEDEAYRKFPSIINDSRNFEQEISRWKNISENVSVCEFTTIERDFKNILSKYLNLSHELPRENLRQKYKLNIFGRILHKIYKFMKSRIPSIENIVGRYKQKIWIRLARDKISIDLEKLRRKLDK